MFNELDSRIFQFDFSKLFDFNYIFEKSVPADFGLKSWFLLFGILGIIANLIAIRVVDMKLKGNKPLQKFLKRFFSYDLTISAYFIVITLLRIAGFTLYVRFFMYLAFIAGIVLTVYGIVYWTRILPKKAAKFEESQSRSRYLPKKKA